MSALTDPWLPDHDHTWPPCGVGCPSRESETTMTGMSAEEAQDHLASEQGYGDPAVGTQEALTYRPGALISTRDHTVTMETEGADGLRVRVEITWPEDHPETDMLQRNSVQAAVQGNRITQAAVQDMPF